MNEGRRETIRHLFPIHLNCVPGLLGIYSRLRNKLVTNTGAQEVSPSLAISQLKSSSPFHWAGRKSSLSHYRSSIPLPKIEKKTSNRGKAFVAPQIQGRSPVHLDHSAGSGATLQGPLKCSFAPLCLVKCLTLCQGWESGDRIPLSLSLTQPLSLEEATSKG